MNTPRVGASIWRNHRSIVLCLAANLLLVLGCGDYTPTEPPPGVATTIAVSPSSATLSALGDTTRFTATVHDQNGHVMPEATVTYSSSDDSVATVDGLGLVTAAGNGSATITGMSGAAAGSAAVTVEQVVAAVRVLPDSVTLFAIGDTVRLAAEAVDSNGHVVAGAGFEWSSSNEAVASVGATGLVTAVGDGNAGVTAMGGAGTGNAAVAVRAGHAKDRGILVAFYEATGGSDWAKNDNWLTDAPIDDWYGVSADSLGRVLEIVLVANGLRGHLAPELGGLEKLTRLSLAGARGYLTVCGRPFNPPESDIRGERNQAWSETTDGAGIRYARSWSKYESDGWTHRIDSPVELPTRIPSGLANRSQSRRNRLVGRIPPELGDLASLEHLDLAVNELSGPLPPELGRLGNLRILSLAVNELSGPLPPELGYRDAS